MQTTQRMKARVDAQLYRGHVLAARVTLPSSSLEQEVSEVKQRSPAGLVTLEVEVEEEADRRAGRGAVEPAGSRSSSASVFPAVSVPESLEACGLVLVLVLCMDP